MDPLKESPPQTRRKFDAPFKREAVGNWLSSGRSAVVVAKELGLTEGLLFAWRKLLPRLDAALRENRHLREQRDILKKTLGILSAPPAGVLNGSMR